MYSIVEGGHSHWQPTQPVIDEFPSKVLSVKSPHLENLLIKQTGTEHCDAIGVNLRIVAARQAKGHLLLAI